MRRNTFTLAVFLCVGNVCVCADNDESQTVRNDVQTLKAFMQALATGDAENGEQLILDNPDSSLLWMKSNRGNRIGRLLASAKIKRLSVGNTVVLPGNRKKKLTRGDINEKKQHFLMQGNPIPFVLHKTSSGWKVNAGPMIAARKAAQRLKDTHVSGDDWQIVTHEQSGFSFEMPSKPTVQSVSRETTKGTIEFDVYKARNAYAIWTVFVNQYPKGAIATQPNDFLKKAAERVEKGKKAEGSQYRVIKAAEWPMMQHDYSFTYRDQNTTIEFYSANQRLLDQNNEVWMLVEMPSNVRNKNQKLFDAHIKRFFDSIQNKKIRDTRAVP